MAFVSRTTASVASWRGCRASRSPAVIRQRVLEWASTCSIWRGRSASFTTTAIAPAASVPKNAAAASRPRSSRIATRSSGSIPAAPSAAPIPAARSAARTMSLPGSNFAIGEAGEAELSLWRRGAVSTTIVDRLELDAAAETRRIAQTLRVQVGETLRRGGIVVAMSGGVDSSVCAALAVEAVGPGHVLGLGLPERESDPQSLALARDWAGRLAIEFLVEDITAMLEACGCYERRDAAVCRLVPDYWPGWRSNLVPDVRVLDSDCLNWCFIAVQPPGYDLCKIRLTSRELREIAAAPNFKQRLRTMRAYHP